MRNSGDGHSPCLAATDRIALFAVGATLLAVVLIIPQAYLLHIFSTDPALYYVMASKIAETGSPVSSLAENVPSFSYAAGMSYIYAPTMLAFDTFADRLRAIQITNILMTCLFFWLATQYFRKAADAAVVPVLSILFAASLLAEEVWQRAALLPNTDLLPALLTVLAMLVAGNDTIRQQRKAAILLMVGICGIFAKLSLAAIPLTYFVVQASKERGPERNKLFAGAAAVLTLILGLMIANWQTTRIYLSALLYGSQTAPLGAPASEMMQRFLTDFETLFFSALPGTIVPNIRALYQNSVAPNFLGFAPDHYSPIVILGVFAASALSVLLLVGARRLYSQRPYDVILFVVCALIFALVPNSTRRYLMAFQPFLWVCLSKALVPVWQRYAPRPAVVIASATAAVLLLAAVEFRSLEFRTRAQFGPPGAAQIAHVRDVTAVHQAVLEFLAEQNKERTRLLFQPFKDDRIMGATWNVWSIASNLPAYSWDNGFPDWARGRHVLMVLSCIHPGCGGYKGRVIKAAIEAKRKCAGFRPVRHWERNSAIADVFELELRQDCKATPNIR